MDMFVAFNKIWHERLIFKHKSMGFSDTLLDLIEIFLENRFISGQTSEWLPVETSVPKGSILGCLFFLIYINDLSVDIIPTITLLANDTSLFSIIYDAKTTAYGLKKYLQKNSWMGTSFKNVI